MRERPSPAAACDERRASGLFDRSQLVRALNISRSARPQVRSSSVKSCPRLRAGPQGATESAAQWTFGLQLVRPSPHLGELVLRRAALDIEVLLQVGQALPQRADLKVHVGNLSLRLGGRCLGSELFLTSRVPSVYKVGERPIARRELRYGSAKPLRPSHSTTSRWAARQAGTNSFACSVSGATLARWVRASSRVSEMSVVSASMARPRPLAPLARLLFDGRKLRQLFGRTRAERCDLPEIAFDKVQEAYPITRHRPRATPGRASARRARPSPPWVPGWARRRVLPGPCVTRRVHRHVDSGCLGDGDERRLHAVGVNGPIRRVLRHQAELRGRRGPRVHWG